VFYLKAKKSNSYDFYFPQSVQRIKIEKNRMNLQFQPSKKQVLSVKKKGTKDCQQEFQIEMFGKVGDKFLIKVL